MIHVIATIHIAPGSLADVTAAAQPLIEATRREAGCISYDLLVSVTDPGTMIFVEEWESRDALEAHFRTPHIGAWAKARAPFVQSSKVVIVHADRIETL